MKLNLLIATGLLAMSSSSWAALSYDANVTGGVIYGSGNANGGWTIDTSNGVELGLRTHKRLPSPANTFNSNGDGSYSWADANGNNIFSYANGSSWNYDFSINSGNIPLASLNFQLWIDSDPSLGQSWTQFNPLSIFDNAVSGNLVQNSENARYPIVGIAGYDNTIAGTYDFKLEAYTIPVTGGTASLVASVPMRVNVNGGAVPDTGATLGLLALSLGGLGALRRKLIA